MKKNATKQSQEASNEKKKFDDKNRKVRRKKIKKRKITRNCCTTEKGRNCNVEIGLLRFLAMFCYKFDYLWIHEAVLRIFFICERYSTSFIYISHLTLLEEDSPYQQHLDFSFFNRSKLGKREMLNYFFFSEIF